jgi:hypothetical protein
MKMQGTAKLSPQLAEHIESVDESSVVDVIVELNPLEVPTSGSRQERVASLKEQFQRELRPVAKRVVESGGQVIETAWINQTMRSRVPAGELSHLAEEESVNRIDLPRMLDAEA